MITLWRSLETTPNWGMFLWLANVYTLAMAFP